MPLPQHLTLVILSTSFSEPRGLEGGGNAQRGQNLWLKKDGGVVNLGGKNSVWMQPGDRLRILSPGGGAYGHE